MKAEFKSSLLIAVLALLFSSCSNDWGQADPPAGNQVYPTMEKLVTYTFDTPEELDPLVFNLKSYPDGEQPAIVDDAEAASPVLKVDGGYVRMVNPWTIKESQKAVSMTFWLKQVRKPIAEESAQDDDAEVQLEPQDIKSPLFHWENENGSATLDFSTNGWWKYAGVDGSWEVNNPDEYATGYITPDEWHYVALVVSEDSYDIYVDGEKKVDAPTTTNCSNVVQFIANAPYMYINYGADTHASFLIEDLTIIRNAMTAKEIARPKKGNIGSGNTGGDTPSQEFYDPIYFNSFNSGEGDASIVGSGSIINAGGVWGGVFSNAMDGMRQNYLLLPDNLFTKSADTQAVSIVVWVNRGNETVSSHYMWSPLFTAYGAAPGADNTFPMLACQYRGVLQVNCNGWSDYTDAQNVNGVNSVYHDATDWLADGQWHLYTATFTPTTAKVYFDGELKNEWEIDGSTNTAAGLFSNGADLKYICLGGNQAWNWSDPDPGFWFDDFAIYNQEISPEQIKHIMSLKNPLYFEGFDGNKLDGEIVGGGSILDTKTPAFGKVFSNAMDGMRQNYFLLPSSLWANTGANNAVTIGVWVNRGNESVSSHYMWSPLFMAYGEAPGADNHAPVLACQYRGIVAVNTNGADNAGDNWSDYTDAQNVNGQNILYHDATDWLADGQWHYYTATFTPTTAKVYFDGVLKNAWEIAGTGAGNTCDIFGNANFTYVCLGGNQAWNWSDPDPGFWFDDIAIYDWELSESDIANIVANKK